LLSWLDNLWHSAIRGLGDIAGTVTRLAVQGVASVVSYVFGTVSGAWDELERASSYLDRLLGDWMDQVTSHLVHLITVDIPQYAQTAWWWVTHLADLAKVLFWYLVRELEDNAW